MSDAIPLPTISGSTVTWTLPLTASPAATAAATNLPNIDPARAFAALGNPLRWQMVKMLADGRALMASEMAATLGRDFDAVSKHLRILRAAGVLASRPGKDRRLALFHIPEANLRPGGVADYGFCVIRAV